MKIVVFLGPSLPLDEARRRLDAIYLPPVAQGDLIGAVTRHRPDVVAIIDGVFNQSLSVWHKEILHALDRGVAVFGASSMGALRALETAELGMTGVGRIYQMYVDGEIDGDDEVALLHGSAEVGYRPLTLPMVNVRLTLRRAVDEGVLDEGGSAELTVAAKAIGFEERTFPALFAAARRCRGYTPRIESWLRERYVDQKALDAIELLSLLRERRSLPAPPRRFDLARTPLFEVLHGRDRKVAGELRLGDLAAHAAVSLSNFTQINRDALHRGLALRLAELLEVDVCDADVDEELRRFRRRHAIERPEALTAWLDENDLDAEELCALLRDEARCRALRRWLVTVHFKLRGTKLLLDELRLRGRYAALKRDASEAERAARTRSPGYEEAEVTESELVSLAREQIAHSGLRIDDDPSAWLREAGFLGWDELIVALLRARNGREQRAQRR